MVDIDFDKLSDDELQWLSTNAYQKMAFRKKQAQEREWNNLIKTIKTYCEKYGEITLIGDYEEYVLDAFIKQNCIGEIDLRYED